MIVEAVTLDEAYSKAAAQLNCSVTQLDLQVIQYPSKGFLGFGKKNAIVEVCKTCDRKDKLIKPEQKHTHQKQINDEPKHQSKQEINESPKARVELSQESKKEGNRRNRNRNRHKNTEQKSDVKPAINTQESAPKKQEVKNTKTSTKPAREEEVKVPKADPALVVGEVQDGLKILFKNSCYEITKIEVSVFDEETLLIEFDGPDAALLIGKEGYRYKAISYMIYNWINIKYGLGIRLEIAQFLKNQEEMMDSYLANVIQRVNSHGKAQTKILDGVLIKIALEKLRIVFPEKYVGIKSGREGGRFIVINDFNRKNK